MSSSTSTLNNTNDDSDDALPPELPFIPIGHPDTMMSKESVRRAVEEFRVRPSDIIVSTFPKTGTTLVTWICHLLRTNGSDLHDFETLYEVVPWPLLSWDIGYDPNVQGSEFTPRVFKSHLRMASIYRGCKYIVTIRDPLKTALSFYNFLAKAKQVPQLQDMDLSTFTRTTPFLQGIPGGVRASIWEFYQEYHILRDCPSVLILVYEDLVKDMETNVHRIAKFMNIKIDNEEERNKLIQRVTQMSTKEYMAKYMSKFDEPYERAKQLGRVGDLSQLAPGAKVAVNKHQQVMDEQGLQFLQEKWEETMSPLGYPDYESFAQMIRSKNRERFSD